MQYDQSNQGAMESPSVPLIQSVTEKLREEAQGQAKLIFEIQEKLHSVKNMRQPDNKGDNDTINTKPNDWSEEIGAIIGRLSQNKIYLSDILRHLERII